jgi:hypothetical protein
MEGSKNHRKTDPPQALSSNRFSQLKEKINQRAIGNKAITGPKNMTRKAQILLFGFSI